MFIQPVDYFLLAWFVLALASALYVGWDQYRNNPEPVVMKWGFILVTLYMGPLGLLLYVLADKEPRPGEHEKFIAPLWKQGVGSTMHCVAGDATGIILAAVVTATLGRVHRAFAGVAFARGSHVSGDAHGRRTAELLHD
jgi:manganese oxidase